jgi:ABC-2 type transport system ATP-binding protein
MVTTHYMDEAEHCDRLAFIDSGRIIAFGTPAEIKRTQMPGQVVEIRTDRPVEALGDLEQYPGVREAALYGAAIHAVVEREATAADLTERLRRQGFRVLGIEPIAPSLEDVFVALAKAQEAAA